MKSSELLSKPDVVCRSNDMARSFENLLGRSLLSSYQPELTTRATSAESLVSHLYRLPAIVLCHDGSSDPIFTYANLAAQRLFEYSWNTFLTLHSRQSAEPDLRDGRAEVLARALAAGFIEDYSGIRIAASGRRFEVSNAIIWNVSNEAGQRTGQAAVFDQWRHVP